MDCFYCGNPMNVTPGDAATTCRTCGGVTRVPLAASSDTEAFPSYSGIVEAQVLPCDGFERATKIASGMLLLALGAYMLSPTNAMAIMDMSGIASGLDASTIHTVHTLLRIWGSVMALGGTVAAIAGFTS